MTFGPISHLGHYHFDPIFTWDNPKNLDSEVGYLRPSPLTCWDSSLSPAKQIFAQSFPNFDVSGYFFNKGGNISCNFQKNLCRNYWVCRNLVFCRRSVFCKSSVFWLSFQKASQHYLKENNSFWIWRYFAFRWRQICCLSNPYASLLITYFTIHVLWSDPKVHLHLC